MGTHERMFIHGLAWKRWWRPREEVKAGTKSMGVLPGCRAALSGSAVPPASILCVLLPLQPLHRDKNSLAAAHVAGGSRAASDERSNICSRKSKAQKAGEHSIRADNQRCISDDINDIPSLTLLRMGATPPLAVPAAVTPAWLNASCRTFHKPYQLINAPFANAQARGILHQPSCRSCRVLSSCQKLLRTSLKRQLSSNSGKSAPSRFHQGLWEQKVCFSFREQLCPSYRKVSLAPKRIVFSYKRRSFKCKWSKSLLWVFFLALGSGKNYFSISK